MFRINILGWANGKWFLIHFITALTLHYVENWSAIEFQSFMYVLKMLIAFPWFFIWYCKFAELITCTLEHVSVILISTVAFLYNLASSSTSSCGYKPQSGTATLDFIPRAIVEASGRDNVQWLSLRLCSALYNQNNLSAFWFTGSSE